jgi:hypothetical protein
MSLRTSPLASRLRGLARRHGRAWQLKSYSAYRRVGRDVGRLTSPLRRLGRQHICLRYGHTWHSRDCFVYCLICRVGGQEGGYRRRA